MSFDIVVIYLCVLTLQSVFTPLASNGVLVVSLRAYGYDPSDLAVGGHAPIRCRNATILPR